MTSLPDALLQFAQLGETLAQVAFVLWFICIILVLGLVSLGTITRAKAKSDRWW